MRSPTITALSSPTTRWWPTCGGASRTSSVPSRTRVASVNTLAAFWILPIWRPISRPPQQAAAGPIALFARGRPPSMEDAMAGHSQFKNIMHRKGRQDKVRSKLFSKLAREITGSAKLGVPDPAMNPRLRAAMLAARAENMPKDNMERAIKKALGGDAENYDEIRYEGYGPGGVAVVVEVLTDNRNRTAGEVRAAFTKSGGNLAETGAVSFMFDHVGVVEYDAGVASADAVLEAAIDAGV